ncbi:SDR family NAD(P)-dependent oxidoreductase [Paenibacillus aurantiacus]|uniref:SDR family NAD(P)-dependent oxidoreductase n=1 Tax=Paenibacillus aurantiacus TaxID=1936118 RepID=A0ABV5KLL1_9BACL
MLSILHNYANGLIAVPVLLACRKHGLFELLGTGQAVPFGTLTDRLGANAGHLRTALAMLESLGWAQRDEEDRYMGMADMTRQRLIPGDMAELLDFPIQAYIEGADPSLSLADWTSRAAAGWGIDDPLLAEMLDGMLFVPLITQLKGRADLDSRGASDPGALLDGLSGRVQDEVAGLLRAKGWLKRQAHGDELTELGRFLIDRMYNTAILYSYKPMLRQMGQVIFGDCQAVFQRGEDGHESHIDRTLNVTGSGFQHEKYFADMEAAVLAVFDREPLESQPDYIADMGCGDGTLLYRLHEMVCAKSLRGKHLDRYPLRLIGIDYNEKALEATRETLKGLNPLTLTGDIGNPAKLMADLAALGVDQPERILHVRSFLDHDRIYLPPAADNGIDAGLHGVDEGIFVAADGRELPAGDALRSLVEHLRKWASVVSAHGLLVLEVHNLKPAALRGQIDKSESFHFDAFHRFSQQLLVEADQFLLAAAAAGLFPHEKYSRKYPKTLDYARITLNNFEPRGYIVRTASPADLDALEELERQCWDPAIRTSRATLAGRIARHPMGQLVVVKEGRIVGSIYSQRIASASQLLRARIDDVESLHQPGTSVVQLLGIQVLPGVQNEGIGDQLLEFALQLCSVTGGVSEVAGVSRCRDYARQTELTYAQYVAARNSLGLPKDATLRFHEMHGARVSEIVSGYRPLDAANEGNGVLVRYELRTRRRFERGHAANAGQSAVDSRASRQVKARDTMPYQRFLEATIKLMLGDPAGYDAKTPLMDMGLDSADLLELSEHINAKYGVALGTTFFFKYGTVDKMANYLSELAPVNEDGAEARQHEAGADQAAPEMPLPGGGSGEYETATGTGIDSGQGGAAAQSAQPADIGNAEAPLSDAGAARDAGGIALVGAACRLPGGIRDLESLWELLLEGRDAISVMSGRWQWPSSIDPAGEHKGIDRGGFLERIDEFDPAFFRMPASTAEWTDPQQRMLMELSWECLEHAGYPPSALAGTRTGVYIGASGSDYHLLLGRSAEEVDARFGLGSSMSMLPNRISYYYDLLGPSLLIDTACSSSLVAVHEAVHAIRRGDCDQALVGAVHLMCDSSNTVSYYKAGMLSPTGACRTFDQSADGYARGEGAAMLLLKPLARALADGDSILGVIEGTAVNHGGHASGLTVPNPSQQAALVKDALRDARVAPEMIGYVEAHGTGTPLGDPIEVSGLTEAFADGAAEPFAAPYCGIGSIKTNIGHLEAAAGIAGLLKAVLAIRRRTLPANAHFAALNREIDLTGSPFYVVDRAREWRLAGGRQLRYAGVSSFGSGGTNAHVVLREHLEIATAHDQPRPAYLFTLSARTPEALERRVRDLLGWLRREAGRWSPAQVSAALAMGREHFQARKAYVADDLEALRGMLERDLNVGAITTRAAQDSEGLTTEREQEGAGLAARLAEAAVDEAVYLSGLDWLRDLYEAGSDARSVLAPLYGGIAWRGVRPPAYPFAKERYWLPKTVSQLIRVTGQGGTQTGQAGAQTSHAGAQTGQAVAQTVQAGAQLGQADAQTGQGGAHAGHVGELRAAAFASSPVKEPERPTEERMLDVLLETTAELLNAELTTLDGDTELGEYGFDSILYLQLSRQLNGAFDFGLTPADFFTYSTLGRLASYLAAQGGETLARRLSAEARSASAGPPPIGTEACLTQPSCSTDAVHYDGPVLREATRISASESQETRSGQTKQEPVAIVGMSGVFPMAKDVHEFWRNLLEGKDCIGELPENREAWFKTGGDSAEAAGRAVRWGGFVEDIDLFDPLFFGISPKEAELMDPQQRLLLMQAWKALEDAGCNPRTLSGGNTAVFAGMMSNGYNELIAKSGHPIDGHYASGTMASVGPNRLSYFLNIHGPSEPVETACSSSLVAIYRAIQAIQGGACDMALAGGVNTLISPDYYESFIKAGMLSPDGRCKTFSDKADGYVRSEGAAMLVLKKLSAAERDGDHVYAVIRGAAVNHGGRASSLTAPNPRAQADLLVAAYAQSGIDPRTVTYIETHGTGTELGDPIEINGLKSAFRELYARNGASDVAIATCGLGAVKSNVGHLELAAGVAGVVKVLLQMKHKKRVKSLHCETINPYIQLDGSPFYIVRQTEEWEALTDDDGLPIPRRAGVSSFGFGGANAHLVLEEYVPMSRRDADVPRIAPDRPGVFVLSAKEEDRLREQAEQLLAALNDLPQDRLADVAYTLQTGREAMEERLAIVAGSASELARGLSLYLDGKLEVDGIYRGSARRGGQLQSASERTSVASADLALLAASWVRGIEADWASLYEANRRPVRIPLPTYPFARERCWVDPQPNGVTAGASGGTNSTGALHPLVQRNTSTFAEQRYSSTFGGGEFYLRDHRVAGRRLLPGVGYLEMARAAASLASGARAVRIEDAVWIRPFYVEGGPRDLHIRLQPDERGRIACEMFSMSDEGEELLHAQAVAIAEEPDERLRPAALDMNGIIRRSGGRTMNGEACYRLFDASALQYGPTFRGIDTLYIGDQEALAKLSLRQETVSGTEEGFALHPGMMDTAIQACVGLLAEKLSKEPHPFLPFTAAAVEAYADTADVEWAHVRLREGAVDRFDVKLCDERGSVLVYVRELVFMKAVDRAGANEGTDAVETVLPAAAPDSLQLNVQEAAVTLAACVNAAQQAKPMRSVPWDEASLETLADTERTFAGLLWGQLHAAGFIEPGFAPADLMNKTVRLRAPYDKWMRESLAVLARAGYLVPYGDAYAIAQGGGPDAASLWEQWRTRKARWLADPDLAARVRLAEAALLALPDILAGAVKPTEILFPGGSMELVEGIYKHNSTADYYNAVVADVVEAFVRNSAEAGMPPVRILEVGAGTGGTSAEVLRRLRRYRTQVAEYGYTDLSRAFLIHAEREYGAENPYLTYRILNAEQPFEEQGLDCGAYDLVLATNVLHATRNVRRTLRHCKSALKPGGLIILNELTEKSVFAHVTFGLLDGWWLYEEEHIRLPGSPCLSAEQWTRALEDEGYRNVGYAANDRGGQQIIWSESDGVLRHEGVMETQSVHRPASVPASAVQNTVASPPTERGDAAMDRQLREHCTAFIVQTIAEAVRLPIGKIDPADPMERYGIDSILIVQVSNKLEKAFGHVGKTLLFEHRTINELTEYFVQSRAEALRTYFGLTSTPGAPAASAAPAKAGAETIGLASISGHGASLSTAGGSPVKKRFLPVTSRPAAHAAPSYATNQGDIAIIGLAGRYPGAGNADEFWSLLKEGRSAITEVPANRWDWRAHYAPGKGQKGVAYTKWAGFIDGLERFDSLLFQISPAEAAEMDPHERAFLEVAYECLEDAGYAPSSIGANGKVGVFVGVTHGASGRGSRNYSVANRVSYAFDLKGPSLAVDTACSSSLTALHLACDSLRSGSSDCAIAGGVNLIIKPDHLIVLSEFTMLSEGPACRAFGDGADGFVDGEGAGAVLLKPLDRAIADGDHIYGVVKGSMINAGGRTNGYTVPNPTAHAKVIEGALEVAGVKADEVSYIEAHGTGTALGDPIEVRGLTLAFRQHTDKTQYCAIGSVKTNIGHGESAAGIAGLTKVLMQMKHGQLAPSLHSETLNPAIDFPSTPFRVQRELAEWKRPAEGRSGGNGHGLRIAGISSFGAGGSNAHVVISEYAANETGGAGAGALDGLYVIALSARSEEQLQEQARRLLQAIRQGKITDENLRNAAYTLQVGREPMEERMACVAGSVTELESRLTDYLAGERQHLHRGQAKQNKELLALLQDEEALRDVVRSMAGSRNVHKLAALWARGFAVEWSLLYEDGRPRRMSLPTYPFGGQRYPIWRGQDQVSSNPARMVASHAVMDAIERMPAQSPSHPVSPPELDPAGDAQDPGLDTENLTLIPVWETVSESGDEERPAGTAQRPGITVMIGGNDSLREAVCRHHADTIFLDVEPRVTIEQLIDKLAELASIECVIWAAPEEWHGSASDERLIQAQEEGTLAAFRVVKAMLELGYGTKELAWIFLTWQSQQVRPDEPVLPHHAGIHGLAGVMAKEYPFWRVVSLDLELDKAPDLTGLPAFGGSQGCYARRGNQWYKQLLIPREQGVGQSPDSVYRQGGVYVVIGGAGGIGEAWTEYMIRRYRAQIVWVGRRAEDEAIRLKIRELSRFGPAPCYIAADAADREALEGVRRKVNERFGAINGIVHSAIVMLDQGLMRMEEERFRSALTAKIDVSVRLAQVFGAEKLDFVLFFSSVNSFMRAPGQSNYVAGCLFKDMFARALGREWTCRVKVMNWGYWGTVGIVASDAYRDRLAQAGLGSVAPEEGMQALEELLSGPHCQTAFMSCNMRFEFDLIDRGARISHTQAADVSRMEALRRKAGKAQLPNGWVQPEAAPYPDSRIVAQLEAAMLELAAAGMDVDGAAMDADASLAEQGINPIAWARMLSQLSDGLGESLTALPSDVRLTFREAAIALGERHRL